MTEQLIDHPLVLPRAGAEDLPDPSLFWRWVGGATRPLIGWGLALIGVVVIIIGWFGISGEAIVAKQIPYLISGGLGGIALVGVGAALIGTERLRQDATRLARLEEMVAELRDVLLTHPDALALPVTTPTTPLAASPGAANNSRPATGSAGGGPVALATGTTYHRPDCSMVRGKPGVAAVSAQDMKERSLSPCRICDPVSPRV